MPATAALVQAHRNSRDQGSCQSAAGCASTTLTLLQLAQRIAAQRCTPLRPYRQPLACRWRGRNPHSDVQSPVPSFPRVPSLRAFVRRPLAAAVGFGMGRHPKASTMYAGPWRLRWGSAWAGIRKPPQLRSRRRRQKGLAESPEAAFCRRSGAKYFIRSMRGCRLAVGANSDPQLRG
jgi:hypothetical protein